MFSYIKGPLAEIWENQAVVEAGGIGWNIQVPVSVLDQLPRIGEEVRLYTSFQVREDAMTLYGFLTRQDLKMFEQLLGVNGIGPKAALGILSVLAPDDLRIAIVSEDAKAIAKTPGIGPKTAKRVILDLKDKISMEEILSGDLEGTDSDRKEQTARSSGGSSASRGVTKDAIEALTALGYSLTEASRAVRKVEITDGISVEAVLKASLKYLAG
ncbi:Holliday junction branch migration protein RuvA [Brotaphodocola sp.]|uniref:Holliday junction branch migration protein RuvA n=1 Tax=Brotaphodocola sp. TaxID=3073577 RepID=UPI003D7CB7DA